jgi:plastocyanin
MNTRTTTLVSTMLLACTGGASAAEHEVRLDGMDFVPPTLNIQAGDTVTWRNTFTDTHNVVADDRSFRKPVVGGAWTYSRTFTQPGEVPYFCELHGAAGGLGMSGVIRVAAATSAFNINEGVQGSWLNNATQGQGVFFDVVPGLNNLFAMAWFTWTQTPGQYDWLTAVGSYAGSTAQMTVFRSRGGRFNASDPVTNSNAGSATVTFTSCTTANVTYTLTDPPATGSFPLQRLLPASAVCLSANPPAAIAD